MNSLTVLVLDDEQRVLDEIEEFLKNKDYIVYTAAEVETAYGLLEKESIDIVILDIKLPGISGLDVLSKIKSSSPDIEVIILTGHGSEADRDVCMGLGAFAYLQKPVDIDELSETIKKANEQIRLKQERKKV